MVKALYNAHLSLLISVAGFYTKLNVWGSLGLNFEYDGGPIIENGGPIFLEHPCVKAQCCPQVSNFEGHVWPPSNFLGAI